MYDDVAGLDNAKQDLSEIVEYLKDPRKYTALGAEIPKGILLMGPPGTGKTMLARATAGEARVSFYSISGSEFVAVVVMAATNRPDVLDPALTRPGRFDRQVVLELPGKSARVKILKIHARRVPVAEDVDFDNLAARTVGMSGADLKNMINEAALLAGRQNKERVESEDFEQARDKVLLGMEREEVITGEEKRLVAYHEAGHALVASLLPGSDPLQKVTIIPRGRAMGATEQVPETDRHSYGRRYLIDRIKVMLGGRAAEMVVFGDVTNGAANDLEQSTRLARRMVCRWGMSDRLGPVAFSRGDEHVFLGREMAHTRDFSESTARIMDEEIQRIVMECQQEAIDLAEAHREKLDAIAQALQENETLDREQIEALVR